MNSVHSLPTAPSFARKIDQIEDGRQGGEKPVAKAPAFEFLMSIIDKKNMMSVSNRAEESPARLRAHFRQKGS